MKKLKKLFYSLYYYNITMYTWNYTNYINWRNNGCSVNQEVTQLLCQNNELAELKYLDRLPNLAILNISNNRFTSLDCVINTSIRELYCNNNQLENINQAFQLTNLIILCCIRNNIVDINNITNTPMLRIFNCSHNNITNINAVNNLHNLQIINYDNNPITVSRDIVEQTNNINEGQDVYSDRENVHNHHIQTCVIDSINNIMICNPMYDINAEQLVSDDNILTDRVKAYILEYCSQSTIIMALNISFARLLFFVWNRIIINKHATEIKNILNENIMASAGFCFTGRFTSLLNCLVGFDELVNINISDNDQIGHIISQIRHRLQNNNNYTINNHKNIAVQELTQYGYSNDIIDEWVDYI